MRRAFVLVLLVAAACGTEDRPAEARVVETGSRRDDLHAPWLDGTSNLRVLTQNLYVGTDVAPILISPVEQIPTLVAKAFGEIQQTDFPARAEQLAREIDRASPHLIGLQEAELIRVQSPGDSLSGRPTPATDVAYDYLEILQHELSRLGLCYRVALVASHTDLELPAATGARSYDDVRLTDRDVILARCDVETSNPEARHFKVNLKVPVGGFDATGVWATILRGWGAVDATVGGRTVRFVNTHLEPAPLPFIAAIQLAQAKELLAALATEPRPVFLVGDFNSAADGSTTPTYDLVTRSGFADAWRLARNNTPGYTCCQAADLQNESSLLDERIDFVFVRDWYDFWLWGDGGVSAFLVSDELLPGYELWPSDHAGVAAGFRIFRRPLLSLLPSPTLR